MKIKIIKLTLIGLCITMFAACGSSGDNNNQFAGIWEGILFLVSEDPNGCASSESMNVVHEISQSGNTITLVSNGATYTGELTSLNSFEISIFSGSGLSPTDLRITYEEVTASEASVAFSLFQGVFTEEVQSSCAKEYSGRLMRRP